MQVKISDYVVDFFYKNGISTLFSLTGGFSMHLNDSFGKHGNYNIFYQHHEQACAYSATGFTKTNSTPCVVCTTAGVAATNAISPCLVAYQDSLPIVFISGTSKSVETTRTLEKENPKMKLRHYAGQDCDIISMVKSITKYAYEITEINEIPKVLKEAMQHMINGRPGPVWLSIPLDIQGYFMDEKEIPVIVKDVFSYKQNNDDLNTINELLSESKRPLIIAGNGVKIGLCTKKFTDFFKKYKIPVVVSYQGTDLIKTDDPLYVGKVGLVGDRAGNFALQNCDLLISLGCRMSQGIVGYNLETFAREAKIIYMDIDENEIEKNNLNYKIKMHIDLESFFDNYNYQPHNDKYNEWINKCNHWKNKWQFEMPENISDENGINPYFALKKYFAMAPENKIIICSSGSIVTNVWHMTKIKEGDRFIISGQVDMGFEITAAIGAQIAEPEKMVVPILGEGALQFNIQELQTIVHHKFPIKIFLFNNNAYGANVITQKLYFKNKYGCDNESDLSFPSSEKIAKAYGIDYICARKNEELEEVFDYFLKSKDPIICEVFSCIQQRFPKLSSKKNDDGTFSSRPLEDMEPFLSKEELEREMIVKMV